MKNEMLKDRISTGIRSDAIRERLFIEKDLTLENVMKIIEAAEASKSNVHHVQELKSEKTPAVQFIRKKKITPVVMTI